MLEFNLAINNESLNQLQSKELKTNLKKMLEAMAGMNKNQWQYAVRLHNIVINEYYKPDFDSITSFGKAIGLEKSSVSRYIGAVRVMVNDVTPLTNLTMEDVTYSKAARLAGVKDVKDFLNVTGVNLVTITSRELEKAIKDYKAGLDGVKDVAPQEEKPQEEKPQEQEVPSFTGRYDNEKVWFEINGNQFIIPIDALADFKA